MGWRYRATARDTHFRPSYISFTTGVGSVQRAKSALLAFKRRAHSVENGMPLNFTLYCVLIVSYCFYSMSHIHLTCASKSIYLLASNCVAVGCYCILHVVYLNISDDIRLVICYN